MKCQRYSKDYLTEICKLKMKTVQSAKFNFPSTVTYSHCYCGIDIPLDV